MKRALSRQAANIGIALTLLLLTVYVVSYFALNQPLPMTMAAHRLGLTAVRSFDHPWQRIFMPLGWIETRVNPQVGVAFPDNQGYTVIYSSQDLSLVRWPWEPYLVIR